MTAQLASRVTAMIGVAAVAAAALAATGSRPAAISADITLLADSTALILCGTTCPTPDQTYVDIVRDQYIAPTHPGQDITYVPVTAPQEMWPATGVMRLLGLALGDPRLFQPGGPAWPDEPVWKLSGLFDLTANQSLAAGAADLEAAIADHDGDHLVVYGLSQGAGIANVVKKNLAARYPVGTTSPDIDFVLSGDPNLPNGGLMSRFPGLYIPIIDMPFNGPAATDTPFDTVEINRQYDGFTDFPLHPRNALAVLNAILGILYVHTNSFDVSLPADPTTSPAYQGTHGDTSYYFFENPDLPLFGPLRTLGVPEKVIDVVEPFFRVLVELGYDRSIPAWEPTPARPASQLDLAQVSADLGNAIKEGIGNARALVGAPAPASTLAPATPHPANAPTASALAVDTALTDPPATPVRSERSPVAAPATLADSAGDPGPSRGVRHADRHPTAATARAAATGRPTAASPGARSAATRSPATDRR